MVRSLTRLLPLVLAFLTPLAVQAQTSASPYTTGYRYDAANRPVGTIAPDPDGTGPLKFAATRNTYDSSGRVIKQETGQLSTWKAETIAPSAWGTGFTVLSSVETTYDTLDRKVQEISKGSDGVIVSAMQYSYDGIGRLDCSAVRMNLAAIPAAGSYACALGTAGSFGNDRVTKNIYDVAGQLLTVQKAFGTPRQQYYVTYTYSNNGKQASVKDANGNLASLTYDGHDRQTRWTFPSKTLIGSVDPADYEQYGYDANGNRITSRKRDGSTLTFSYDALNRITNKVVPERAGLATTHTRDVFYGYDNRGLQLYGRFDSASGEGITTAYDGFGGMASSAFNMDGVTRILTYAFDKNSNRSSVTHPDGQVFNYQYDGLDRMKTFLQATTSLGTMTYNTRGLRATLAGATSTTGVPTTSGYDTVGRLSTLAHNLGGTATTQDVTYTLGYSSASQVVSQTTSNDSYAYGGAVNVNRNYGVNGLNQYTTAGPATFSYDANGNLTGDGSSTYLYDVENRLVSASGGTTASLRYDPLGRLYETSANTVPTTTRFLYDGDELVAEYNSTNTLLRRYVHGPGNDDPLIWYEGTSVASTALRRIRTNHQGSVVVVTDNAGAGITINAYDEWGIPAATNMGRFQYTGQAWIPELGMYHYKARIYSPTLGRFLQTDPIGYDDQVNLYAYVANDPVNNVDPDGEALETIWDVGNVVIGVASAADNISKGNYGSAIVDAVGVVVDGAATVVPFVPGGAGAAIKAARAGDKAIGVSRASGKAAAATERARNIAKGVPATKIGGSGKPKVHTVQHSTRKGQTQAAQREANRAGGKVRHDTKPTDGQKPHMQAEDAKGKNVQPVVHHCGPKKNC